MEKETKNLVAYLEALDIRTNSNHSTSAAIPQGLGKLGHQTGINLEDIQRSGWNPFHPDLNLVLLRLRRWNLLDRQGSLQSRHRNRWMSGHNTQTDIDLIGA
jgi:hypothetical protein